MSLLRHNSNYQQSHEQLIRPQSICPQCLQFQFSLKKHRQQYNRLISENKKLFETVQDFQQQNLDLMGQCGKTYREYEHLVERLNKELLLRDQIISKLEKDIQQCDQQLQALEIQNEEKFYEYQNMINDLQTEICSLRECHEASKQKESDYSKSAKEIKAYYKQEKTDRSNIQAKNQEYSKLEGELKKLKAQLKIKDELINEKEQLIKKFSVSNDSLMLQLIDFKAKQSIRSCSYLRSDSTNIQELEQISNLKQELQLAKIQNVKLSIRIEALENEGKGRTHHINKRLAGKMKRQALEPKQQDESIRQAQSFIIKVYQQIRKIMDGGSCSGDQFQRRLSGRLDDGEQEKLEGQIMRSLEQIRNVWNEEERQKYKKRFSNR